MPTREEAIWPLVKWRILAKDATYKDSVRCVIMPCCGFAFDARHTDGRGKEVYTCPLCEDALEPITK